MFHLRTKNILDKTQQMHCLITVVAMVLYLTHKKRRKKRITFKKLTCWPSPVKNFSNVTTRNLSRNKMLPFSCTKEKFMKNLSSEECDIVFISLKWT